MLLAFRGDDVGRSDFFMCLKGIDDNINLIRNHYQILEKDCISKYSSEHSKYDLRR